MRPRDGTSPSPTRFVSWEDDVNAEELRDLRTQTLEELGDELVRLRKEQFQLRMQRASELLPQTHLLTRTRRDIARVKTVIREKANA